MTRDERENGNGGRTTGLQFLPLGSIQNATQVRQSRGVFIMKMKISNSTMLTTMLSLALAASSPAESHNQKRQSQRGMLESMQSVPCGAKERGLTGVGSVFGSVGVQHVNSQEQLCPQYLLRTDDMDYHIRPLDKKHPPVLPVGQEAIFKVKKDRMFLRVVDEDKKAKAFQVVAMQPAKSERKVENSGYHSPDKPTESRVPEKPGSNPPTNDGNRAGDPANDNPPRL